MQTSSFSNTLHGRCISISANQFLMDWTQLLLYGVIICPPSGHSSGFTMIYLMLRYDNATFLLLLQTEVLCRVL